MQRLPHCRAPVIAVVCLCLGFAAPGWAQNPTAAQSVPTKEKVVAGHAGGTFDVKLTPQAESGDDAGLGRMVIDKQFHGDLEGTSQGQMISAMGSVKGSAGYVAMERVTGKLKGRAGSFVLQHSGTMTRGTPQLTVTVVPDSGTDQLTGIAGMLTIEIGGGKHSYEFEYTLPETQ
jgi:Protein of unknown function (DUF3224)